MIINLLILGLVLWMVGGNIVIFTKCLSKSFLNNFCVIVMVLGGDCIITSLIWWKFFS